MKKRIAIPAIIVSFLVGWFLSDKANKACMVSAFRNFERPTICKVIFLEFPKTDKSSESK